MVVNLFSFSALETSGTLMHLSTILKTRKYARYIRYRPRFFDQVGHQTTSSHIENKHFFTKSCHRQTNQNYEQSHQKLGTFLENKVLQKISFIKIDLLVKYFLQKKKFRKIQLIFDAEKWLWKYKFCKLWGSCS